MTAVSWVGGSGFWDVASNWSTGQVPGPNDDVTIDVPGASPTVTIRDSQSVHSLTAKDPLAIANGQLSLAADSQVSGGLTISGSTPLSITGTLTVAANAAWTGGLIRSNPGTSGTLAVTGTLTIDTTNSPELGSIAVIDSGTIAQTGANNLALSSAALTIGQGGLYDFQGDGGLGISFGSATVNVQGTLRKSAGTGTSSIPAGSSLEGGTMDVRSGTLQWNGSGGGTGGTISVAPGATLGLNVNTSPNVNGTFLTGTYTGTGGGAVVIGDGAGLAVGSTGATFNFAAGMLQWQGGRIEGPGTLTNAGAMTIAPDTSSPAELASGTIVDTGIIAQQGPNNLVFGTATLTIATGGLYDFQSDSGWVDQGGGQFFPTSKIQGTLRKSGGTGTTTTQVPMNIQGGTLDIESGTLALGFDSNGTSTGGTFKVAAGAAIDLSSRQTFGGTYTGSGQGTVLLTSELDIDQGGATVNFPGAMFQWTGGTINVPAGATLVNAGVLNLDVTNALSLTGGGTLENQERVVQGGGPGGQFAGHLAIGGGSTFQNDAGATYAITGDNDLTGGFGGGAFHDAGTVVKSGGTGTTDIGNLGFTILGGTVEADTGTVAFDFGDTGTSTGGTFVTHAGATVEVGAIGPLTGSYTGTGAGQITLSRRNLNISGTATFDFPAGMFHWTGGELDLPSGATLVNAGELNIDLSNGDLVTAGGGTLENKGRINQTGSGHTFFLGGGSTVANDAGTTYAITGDSNLAGGFAGGGFNDAGTVVKSGGSGTTKIDGLAFSILGGTVEADSGIFMFDFGNTGTSTGGTFVTGAGTQIEIGAIGTLTGAYTGSGKGEVTLFNRNINIGGSGASFNFPAGMFQWGTEIDVAQGATFANLGSITIPDGARTSFRGTFVNTGTITEQGSSSISTGSGQMDNAATGVFDIQGDGGGFLAGSGIHFTLFQNAGLLRKSAGSGTTTISDELDNTGTVEADTGTISIIGTLDQVSGTTLTAGTWVATHGGAVVLPFGADIKANQANLVLDGSGSTLSASGNGVNFGITDLASNRGSFTVTNGATFTTVGDLANTGSLTVGPGGVLTVSGNYTQGSGASYTAGIGGRPASGQFGQLKVTGSATLAGAVNASLAAGFSPAVPDSYPILTYASQTGGDNLSFLGVPAVFQPAVNPTDLTLTVVSGSADLAPEPFTVPVSGTAGQTISFPFTVDNKSSSAANGSWVDSFYLSANDKLDPSDVLITRVPHTGGVAANGSYTGTLTAALPGVVPGVYHVIELVDSHGNVADSNRTNNVLASTNTITVAVPSVALGGSQAATISSGQDVLVQLALPAGQDVQITLTTSVKGAAALYERYQLPPDEGTFDQEAFNANDTSQSVTVANTQAGPYYLLIHGTDLAGSGVNYTLTTQVLGFGISSVSPRIIPGALVGHLGGFGGLNFGGLQAISIATVSATEVFSLVAGDVTLTIHGNGFTPSTQASVTFGLGFSRSTTTLPAERVVFQDSQTILATFSLTQLGEKLPFLTQFDLPGPLIVSVSDHRRTVVASGGVELGFGSSELGAESHLELNVSAPSVVRPPFRNSIVTITYTNQGPTDMPAPLLVVFSNNGEFKLAEDSDFTPDSYQFLAINTQGGPAGVLPPGSGGSITLEFRPKTIAAHAISDVQVGVADNTAAPTDFAVVKDALQPASVPTAVWDAAFANFQAHVGTTVGSLQSALDADATYLGSLGEATADYGRLLQFELQQAGDFGALSRRNTMTAVGLGAPVLDPTDFHASTDAKGTVHVREAGLDRSFARQPDGSFRGQPGDNGTMTVDPSGAVQLRDSDGTIKAFNADGTLNFIQNPNGSRTTAAYTNGRLTSLTDAFGNTASFTYNTQGLIGQITDPVGRVTSFIYDTVGHLITVTDPQGTTQYTYTTSKDPVLENAVSSVTLPDGSHVVYQYDSQGRVIGQSRDNGAQPLSIAYTSPGGYVITDAAQDKTTVLLNDAGQVAKVIDPLGRDGLTAYNAQGLVSQVGLPNGTQSTFRYDALGNPTSMTDPLGQTTTLGFTQAGGGNRLARLADPRGNALNYSYDSSGNLAGIAFPDGTSQQFTDNALSQLVTATDRAGQTTHFTYDAHGLISREDFADGSSATFTYDAHRNPVSMTDSTGTTAFDYDAADRLTKMTYPSGAFVSFTYNAAGQRTSMADQTGYTVNYSYDAVGRLTRLTDAQGNPIVSYTYDPTGRLARADNGNGTSTAYTYDSAGEVLSVVNHAPGGSVQSSFTYTYDDLGRISTMTTAAGTSRYGYDAAGQLVSVGLPDGRTIAYTYDAAGNRAMVADSASGSTAYAVNDLNQYTTAGGTTYTYDANGNVLTKSDAGGTTTYTYDSQDRLVALHTPTDTYTYQYDALGFRVGESHNGQSMQFVIDPTSASGNVVGEFGSGGSVVAHDVYGAGLVSRVDGTGSADFYAFDASGNTADLTGPTGSVLNSYSYLPFGDGTTATGTAPNPFTFAGMVGVTTDGSGLSHMDHRDYDPSTGRFTQPDPLGISGGDSNFYRYVGNDPVSHTDPSGLILPIVGAIAFGAAGAAGATTPLGASSTTIVALSLATGGSTTATATTAAVATASTTSVAGATTGILGGTVTTVGGAFVAGAAAAAVGGATYLGTRYAIDHYAPGVDTAAQSALSPIATIGTGPQNVFGFDPNAHTPPPNAFNPTGGNPLDVLRADNRGNVPRDTSDDGPYSNYTGFNDSQLYADMGNKGQFFQQYFKDHGIFDPTQDDFNAAARAYANQFRDQPVQDVLSGDPNDIIGPAGFGPQGFVPATEALPYTVLFANEPTASAPAQTVNVTEQLSPNLDLSTFQLGNIGFGDTTIQVPAGLTSYHTRVTLPASAPGAGPNGLIVDVSGALNLKTGVVTWTFTSLDPTTLDLPSNPLVGFLPPDQTAPEGEGFVSYTVLPKATVPTGTVIAAKATVVFDVNAPIATRQVSNALDTGAPTSSVTPLPATSPATFTVGWSGNDAGGSGINHFDVFVSDNGGPFQSLLQDTTQTATTFTGQVGHQYSFFSVAIDNVGNVQPLPATAQAVTTVGTQAASFIQFAAAQFSSDLTAGTAHVVVMRAGDLTGTSTAVVSSPGGTDVAAFQQMVTFLPGAATATVAIPIRTDGRPGEPDARIPLFLSSLGPGASLGIVASATLVIHDDIGQIPASAPFLGLHVLAPKRRRFVHPVAAVLVSPATAASVAWGTLIPVIGWGDRTITAGRFRAGPGGMVVIIGAHRYARAGRYTTTIALVSIATARPVAVTHGVIRAGGHTHDHSPPLWQLASRLRRLGLHSQAGPLAAHTPRARNL